MKKIRPIARAGVALTVAYLTLTAVLTGVSSAKTPARYGRRDRGAVTLEQAIVTAVLSGAAIALGIVIVGAVTSHSGNIR